MYVAKRSGVHHAWNWNTIHLIGLLIYLNLNLSGNTYILFEYISNSCNECYLGNCFFLDAFSVFVLMLHKCKQIFSRINERFMSDIFRKVNHLHVHIPQRMFIAYRNNINTYILLFNLLY